MAIRDKTTSNNIIDTDLLNTRVNNLETEVSSIKNGVKFVGEYSTYANMIATLTSPSESDWVFITTDETKSNARTQYIYDSNILNWRFAGGASSVNESTDTILGTIKMNGDLLGSTASFPQLKQIIQGGTYAFGNNTVTINQKGLVSNVVSGTTAYEWIFHSKSSTRPTPTHTIVTPSYDTANAVLMFFYNGLLIPETDNYTRLNSTTLTTNFTLNIDDDILVYNMKYIGSIDFAKLTDNIIPQTPNVFIIGDPLNRYDSINLVNAPNVLSDPKHKRNIENLKINALEFVNDLESYQYLLLDNGKRTHTGLLSTQLKSTMDLFGVDYAMYVKDIASEEEAIRYEELISVLIKAISQNTPLYKRLYYKIKKVIRKIINWIKNRKKVNISA